MERMETVKQSGPWSSLGSYGYQGPVWLDQNWNRFQNPQHLFRPDFLKPNPDSWDQPWSRIHWIQDGGRRWASVSGNFRQFVLAIHNPQFHNKNLMKQHNDILMKFVRIALINSDIWIKPRSRFCICFQETGFGFNILFVYNLLDVFRIRILKSRSGFGLIKQGLCIYSFLLRIYSGGDTRHNEILTFKVEYDLEGFAPLAYLGLPISEVWLVKDMT